MSQEKTKCGFVALIGVPNAGKSTLLNAIMGDKVSIVTPKAQTTRRPVMGMTNYGQTQLIFTDTAGLFSPKKNFEKAMVKAAWERADQADLILYMVDCNAVVKKGKIHFSDQVKEHFEQLKALKKPKSVIFNKVDAIQPESLLTMTSMLQEEEIFDQFYMISATKGAGIPEMLESIQSFIPESPWHYDEHQISDLTDRDFAAELTREKLFMALQDELPYALHVETESWEEFKDGSVKITQNILLEHERHKSMVIGHKGVLLKQVGQKVREELTDIFGYKVHLFLNVRHKPHYFKKGENFIPK